MVDPIYAFSYAIHYDVTAQDGSADNWRYGSDGHRGLSLHIVNSPEANHYTTQGRVLQRRLSSVLCGKVCLHWTNHNRKLCSTITDKLGSAVHTERTKKLMHHFISREKIKEP